MEPYNAQSKSFFVLKDATGFVMGCHIWWHDWMLYDLPFLMLVSFPVIYIIVYLLPYVTHLIEMSRMSGNYIFGKTGKCDQQSFFFIFIFYWKWVQKYVFNISDSSHLRKFSVLVFICGIFETC